MYWPEWAEEKIRDMLTQGGVDPDSEYVVVHPTSRWMFKTWRAEANAEVIDYLSRQKGLPVVLTSAPVPEELNYIQDVLGRTRTRPLDLSGRLSLAELAAVIAGGRLFFGVDSLPMHMAAAVGTQAVALFGPSGENMWGPWGQGHRVVAKKWDCRPCGQAGCYNTKASRCLIELEVEEVIKGLEAALGEGR
ncbi:MAG: glycosyltransferase family 9 protein [Pseudomonadota bacterium]